ncbi:putative inactive purple acid phosphatase 28 [Drosera capensis]
MEMPLETLLYITTNRHLHPPPPPHPHFLLSLHFQPPPRLPKKTADSPTPIPIRRRHFQNPPGEDMHFGNGIATRCRDVEEEEARVCTDFNATRFVRRLIEDEKHLIAFTGEGIIFSGRVLQTGLNQCSKHFAPAMGSRLPWAAIFGNHDQESTLTRAELMSLISLMDYSVSQVNPSAEGDSLPAKKIQLSKIDGFGNYNLEVQGGVGSPTKSISVLDLFFLDSGDRVTVEGRQTYDWIRESQLEWMYSFSQERERWHTNRMKSRAAIITAICLYPDGHAQR